AEADAFSGELLEEAKRFLELAVREKGRRAHLHAALLLGFSALEAHVNGIADEVIGWPGTDVHERGLLSEKAVHLAGGSWKLGNSQYYRLEDRLAFLLRKYAGVPLSSFSWWNEKKSGMGKRNSVVHPRDEVKLTVKDVERCLSSIVEALNDLYLAVFKKSHPAHGRGLDSTLTF
ncbi:MAG: hypothetical protein JWN34_5736, partial [Bryobacterales bacterium]|nr:hypothetical protein [Bryobacterales bacterium]